MDHQEDDTCVMMKKHFKIHNLRFSCFLCLEYDFNGI